MDFRKIIDFHFVNNSVYAATQSCFRVSKKRSGDCFTHVLFLNQQPFQFLYVEFSVGMKLSETLETRLQTMSD